MNDLPPTAITASDTAVQAVAKARAAELALCEELISHFRAVNTLARWISEISDEPEQRAQTLGVSPGEIDYLMRLAFTVGSPGPGRHLALPSGVDAAKDRSSRLVEDLQFAALVSLPEATHALLERSELAAKSQAVVSEQRSLRNLADVVRAMGVFVRALRMQPFSEAFFVAHCTVWDELGRRGDTPKK